MNASNPDHPIRFAKEPGRVQVLFEGHGLASSDDVLLLSEAGHGPVRYFPREDVQMAFLRKTDRVTHCPHKGQASYYTIMRDRQIIENAIWSYEDPLPGVSQIAGRLAFYPEHFDFQVGGQSASDTESSDHGRPAGSAPADDAANRASIDEIVRHTDSGSGASQAAHWDKTVSMPDDEAGENADGPPAVANSYEGTGSI